ncbi:NACHT domain-containing protein, partial [Streptomyces boncukensis]
MDAAVVGARLASSVVGPLVKRLFVTEGPGAGLVDRPVRVSGLVSFRGEKRTLTEPDLLRVAEELVRRAARDLGPHEAPEAGVCDRVAERVTRALSGLGETELTDVDAVAMGHVRFARALHERAAAHVGVPLDDGDEDEAALYHRVLHTACLHVLNFFTQRSTFVARSLAAQSQRLREIVTLVDVLIDRLPSQSAQDAAFERQYARHLAAKHGRVTIYGIDLREAHEWPLDAAYLSLEARSAADGPPEAADTPDAPDGRAAPADPRPVEQALAGHRRVLLRGIAGSGKTTLVQWLAVTTARQEELTGRLAHLVGRVPFVLPLRTLTRAGERLPVPAGFLSAVTSPLSGSQPPGWADRVLAAGRGVLLVDGIDEVPAYEREHTRRWLRDLLSAFPGNLFLVTSRPSAVREHWLGTDDFTELSLSPMRPADVEVFVRRWHQAARAGQGLADDLVASVRAKPDLARLATNPLMCGLICALHRERRGFLPRGRKALYDAALSMLLERRDRERDMHRAGAIELDEESQVELLQKLAYWLIRNGRSEMAQEDAHGLLARVLPAMPHAAGQGSVEEVFRHLLIRSGLLREPAAGRVDFVHRTFQDYLGARAAVEERDFDLLVQHAHVDQWEDVLRMAVAHARPDERGRLLRGLVERGDGEPQYRTRLHLLAMACLEHATKLDPAVRSAVEDRARELIPPRSADEAKELAEVGPVVLELLPGPEGLEADEVSAVAQTASEIGGDAALGLLTRYRTARPALPHLGQRWDRFDTDAYARDIVRHLAGASAGYITVRSADELDHLSRMRGHPRVSLTGAFTPAQITGALDPEQITALTLADNDQIGELDFLHAFPHLMAVDLRRCPHVTDLAPLAPLATGLWLWDFGAQAERLRGLGELHRLRTLVLRGDTLWPGFGELPRSGALVTLYLPTTGVAGLTGIADHPELELVNLHGTDLRLTGADWAALRDLPHLEELILDAEHLGAPPAPSAALPRLPALHVVGAPVDLEHVVRLFPGLQKLKLGGPRGDVDLAPLAALPDLRDLTVFHADRVHHADRLPAQTA